MKMDKNNIFSVLGIIVIVVVTMVILIINKKGITYINNRHVDRRLNSYNSRSIVEIDMPNIKNEWKDKIPFIDKDNIKVETVAINFSNHSQSHQNVLQHLFIDEDTEDFVVIYVFEDFLDDKREREIKKIEEAKDKNYLLNKKEVIVTIFDSDENLSGFISRIEFEEYIYEGNDLVFIGYSSKDIVDN